MSKAKKSGAKRAKRSKQRVRVATFEREPEQPTSETVEPAEPAHLGDADETVVFAIRLSRGERDLIHQAAGSGKASQFVRSLAVAAAQKDMKTLQAIVQGAGE